MNTEKKHKTHKLLISTYQIIYPCLENKMKAAKAMTIQVALVFGSPKLPMTKQNIYVLLYHLIYTIT